jgi:hypothetical protein
MSQKGQEENIAYRLARLCDSKFDDLSPLFRFVDDKLAEVGW